MQRVMAETSTFAAAARSDAPMELPSLGSLSSTPTSMAMYRAPVRASSSRRRFTESKGSSSWVRTFSFWVRRARCSFVVPL